MGVLERLGVEIDDLKDKRCRAPTAIFCLGTAGASLGICLSFAF
jgi:hypothetical protein